MFQALIGVVSGVGRTGTALIGGSARLPVRAVSAGQTALRLTEVADDIAGQLQREVRSLLNPALRRDGRRIAAVEDRVIVEVRGLCSERSEQVAEAVHRRVGSLPGVRWMRVNAVTGDVVAAVRDDRAVPGLVDAIAAAEEDAGVADTVWDPSAEHPADLEPVVSAAISLAGDLLSAGVTFVGAAIPGRNGVATLQSLVALADSQPRIRRLLEQRVGRARTDLLLTTANALAQAAGDSPANVLVDALHRALAVTEHGVRHARWRLWEVEHGHRRARDILQSPPHRQRPVELPPGPVERCADEASAAAAAGAAAVAAGQGLSSVGRALSLAAPKAARASRESFAATVSTLLATSGVLTMDPSVWRRLDRLSALVIDGAVLYGSGRLVLDAETRESEPGNAEKSASDWTTAQVWNAAQRLLWSGPDATAATPDTGDLRLRPDPDRNPGDSIPGWYDVCDGTDVLGRVLVGRELDPRARTLMLAARASGLKVVVRGQRDAFELRSLADEFVEREGSAAELVCRLQSDGHAVGLVATDSAGDLNCADVAIGVSRISAVEVEAMPWAADVVCGDLDQVMRVLLTVAPARQVSERGRVLALSACSLAGLLLAAGRSRDAWPVTAAQASGLLQGTWAGVQAARGRLPDSGAPLVPWHSLEPDEVLTRLPEPERGEPAPTRSWTAPLARIPAQLSPATRFLATVRRELADPLTPILGVGAAASAVLGSPGDAALVAGVVAVNAVVSALQRQRAENALRDLIAHERITGRRVERAVLDHDPEPPSESVPGTALMVGDVIALRTGDVVPADARLLRADDLEVDESALTGESVTVPKDSPATPGVDLNHRRCMVYEASTIVNGAAVAVVVAVGSDTETNRAAAVAVPPRLGGVQAQLRALSDQALPLTLGGGSLVTALGWLRGQRIRAAIADGVAVATAAVPEGLPLVATVAQLAVARRLSRHGLLVRASRTVEALGRVNTICFDKTGTLTFGRLRLTTLADLEHQWSPEDDDPRARRLLRAAAHACPDPDDGPIVHATDQAVLDAAELLDRDERWDTVEELPFESNRGYAATLGQTRRRHWRLIVKGAPEIVLARCTAIRTRRDGADHDEPMSADHRRAADRMIHRMAERGLRVLVVARRDLSAAPGDVVSAVEKLTLLGFIGLADTARPQARPLVGALQRNDIRVRMITGDHPVTAAAIAADLGIDADPVVTGSDLAELDDAAQSELIARSSVFARVSPQQKVRIVTTLQRRGEVVAMAGDGGNDAAAIRTADVGIGLTAQGSTAARNAADLVLTDPDPLVLLHALIEGRGMWRRVADAVGILVGGNAGEVAFTVLGTALAGRAPLGTRQFLLVNMLTDMFPAMAVALSTERSGDEEPTGHQERADLLAEQLAARPRTDVAADLRRTIVIRGSTTAAASTVAWSIARWTGTERRAATVALVALVGTQLGQTVLAARHSPQVWLTAAGSAAFLGTVVMTPGLSTYFGCRPLGPVGWTTALTSAATATAVGALLPSRRPTEPGQPTVAPEDNEYVEDREYPLSIESVGAQSH
ncbi:hypothetical protein C8258_03675 [Nocardia sp. MDA0666]|uniref:cation-translocating P-type ATPase n=1 Tax=Nocardia sp. MDA0666 TaxID=2135448 RepID=UPI000D133C34|nr:cation-translocating P-type ATPase [Nocardia sp. MDA0666]PSR70134.1 hypothetical protein C8258_03675 [Nocardia sp. MDA0666]